MTFKVTHYVLTIVTGGSHSSSDSIWSSVISTPSRSPGEHANHNCRGPSGFGFCT